MNVIKVKFDDLPKNTNTPIFSYCRQLIKEGHDPNTRLEVYRENPEPDVVCPRIGESAKWTVKEEPKLHFAKYKPFSGIEREKKSVHVPL